MRSRLEMKSANYQFAAWAKEKCAAESQGLQYAESHLSGHTATWPGACDSCDEHFFVYRRRLISLLPICARPPARLFGLCQKQVFGALGSMFLLSVLRRVRLPRYGTTYGAARTVLCAFFYFLFWLSLTVFVSVFVTLLWRRAERKALPQGFRSPYFWCSSVSYRMRHLAQRQHHARS